MGKDLFFLLGFYFVIDIKNYFDDIDIKYQCVLQFQGVINVNYMKLKHVFTNINRITLYYPR